MKEFKEQVWQITVINSGDGRDLSRQGERPGGLTSLRVSRN